jgi:hypothetical protein
MKRKVSGFNYLRFAILLFVFGECKAQTKIEKEGKIFPQASQYNSAQLTYEIINAPSSTFAYKIYANKKLLINQNTVPALSGNKGFKTKVAAEKVAKLVITKIKKGEMPPTVTVQEMKKIKAI